MEEVLKTEKQIQREKSRKYYQEHKEVLQQKYKSRVQCPLCLKEVSKASLNSHYKSQLCIKGQEIQKKLKEINN